MGCLGVEPEERMDDALLVMSLDRVGRPLGEVLSEAVGVEVLSGSSSPSPSTRSFILDKRVEVVFTDGDLRWPTTWRALSVVPVRTLVTLAESGVSLESGRSLARDVVLWWRTLVEPDGVRVAVPRATLRIELPELARFPSRDFKAGMVRERTEARREWTEIVSESVSPDPRIKDGRRARDR